MSNRQQDGVQQWPKFVHIVPVFIVIAVLSVAVLAGIRLVFVDHFPAFELKKIYWEFGLPILVAVLSVTIWLRPRVRILEFKKKSGDRRFTFLMLAAAAIALPSMVVQSQLLQATGQLTTISELSELDFNRPERYYSITNFEVLKQHGSVHANVQASGKYNQDLNFEFYFVFPFSGSDSEKNGDYLAWYGIKHRERISNRLDDAEKERRYQQAFEAGVDKVENHDFHDQQYFRVVQPSDDRDGFRAAAARETGSSTDDRYVILVPGAGAFRNETGSMLGQTAFAGLAGLAAILLFLLWPGYDVQELQRQRQGNMPRMGFLDELKEFLIPREDYFAAPILLDAIIIVYLVQVFAGVSPIHPTGSELLEWGANRRAETAGGEWWRLVSSVFLHGGALHLLLNCFGLLLAAMFVEPMFGRFRLFLIFFVSGVAGSIASIWWYENTVSVGASGAIFGLFGAVLSLAVLRVLEMRTLAWLWVYPGVSLLFGLTGGIDNAAHLGGLAAGILIGILLQVFFDLPVERDARESGPNPDGS